MNELVKKMLETLKDKKGLSTSKVERELEFSNGLLGKAAKSESNLSEEKFKKLSVFYFTQMHKGKEMGYMKQLENGEVEIGVVEAEKPKDEKPVITQDAPQFKNEIEKELWEMEQEYLKSKNKKQ